MTKLNFPVNTLAKWFRAHQRKLPWRDNQDPYSVWVSEIMLQQTQVKTALPYFKRWMIHFPTVEALAAAEIEQVIKLWEGLGYYSRARNLHQGAKEIISRFNGKFPSSSEDLLSIKGIGSYTKGAIQSFAFRLRSILVDGNVKRVLARFYDLDLNLDLPKNHRALEELIETILPYKEPWIFNEALMELGALICSPKTPNCSHCPLSEGCLAKKRETLFSRPVRSPRKKRVLLYRVVFICHYQDQILVKKTAKGVMQDLYEFPYQETEHKTSKDVESSGLISNFLKRALEKPEKLPKVTHGFTHHHVTLLPFQINLSAPLKLPEHEWMEKKELKKKPFSSGHKKILKLIGLS